MLLRAERLSPQQREAFALRATDTDYRQIARTLGTSTDNARKLVQTARRTLKRANTPRCSNVMDA